MLKSPEDLIYVENQCAASAWVFAVILFGSVFSCHQTSYQEFKSFLFSGFKINRKKNADFHKICF